MNCRHVSAKLDLYSLGELEPGPAARVEEHLRRCEACRARLERLRSLDGLIGDLPASDAGRDLWPGIRDRLGPRARPSRAPLWQPALAVAAGALVALILFNGLLAPRVAPPDMSFDPQDRASSVTEQYVAISWQTPLADDAAMGVALAMLDPAEDEP